MGVRRVGALFVVATASAAFLVPASAATQAVSVGTFYFEDETPGDGEVTARVGDRLTFTFEGRHSAKVDGQFYSEDQSSGATFTTGPLLMKGVFTLYCTVHGQKQHSTNLTVTDSPQPSPSATRPPTARPTSPPTTAATTPSPKRSATPRPQSKPTVTASSKATVPGTTAPTSSPTAAVRPTHRATSIGTPTPVAVRPARAEASTRRWPLLLLLIPLTGAAGWVLLRRQRT